MSDEPVELFLEVKGAKNLARRPHDGNYGRNARSDQVGDRFVDDRDEGEREQPDVVANQDEILLLGKTDPGFSSDQYQRLESLDNRILTPDEGKEEPMHRFDR